MRQGQQNRRGRGRGRKPQNTLARNYESNGPEVKIRGTASHIAEKYMSLARDALASGDIVAAESCLQYAEHYNRIIMAAQPQMGSAQAGDQSNGGGRQHRPNPDGGEEESAEQPQPAEAASGSGGTARSEGRGRGSNDSEGVQDANGAEPIEANVADENKSTPDTVS
jgi:hypothetical protein